MRTAANCNVLMADRMSLPVAEHREDSEETVRAEEKRGMEEEMGGVKVVK